MNQSGVSSLFGAVGTTLLLAACVGSEPPLAGVDAGASEDATADTVDGSSRTEGGSVDASGPDGGKPGNDSGAGDAGIDADPGRDSGGVDSGSPAPTVSLVTPNIGSSLGGWKLTVTGSNFVSGATLTINGSACTGVQWESSTTMTAVAPTFSTPNGSTTAQTVVVTNPDHQSGGGVGGSYFYLPSNSPIRMFQRADVGVTVGTFVSGWADQSGNGNNWSQSIAGKQPGIGNDYNSTSLPYLTMNGSSDYMTSTFASPITSGAVTAFLVGNFTTMSSSEPGAVALFFGGSGTTDFYFQGPNAGQDHYYVGNTGAAYPSTVIPDTNAHVFMVQNNATTGFIQVDSNAAGGGGLAPASLSATNGLGAAVRGGAQYFAPMNVLLVLVFDGAISTADIATTQSILKQTSNTP